REQVFWAYVFLLPWIIGLLVFIVGPILFSLGLSFFNYTLGREATFVGLQNWIEAFTQDELFWPSISRTYLYTAFVVPLSVFGGNMMVIFLAGLQGIPQELYEAASIDGACARDRFWHVTLPMISPTLFFNSVLALIAAFQTFEVAFIGTRGGPAYATWLYSLH